MTLSFYGFSLLRFVPDIARGEAANLGVVVVDDTTGDVASAFLPDPGTKVSALAPGMNVAGIAASIEQFRWQLGPRHDGSGDGQIRSSAQLAVLSGAMRNQLQLSEPKMYRSVSLSAAAQELYDQLVRPVGAPATRAEVSAVAS